MKTTVTIVDYGSGNIYSIARALSHVGVNVFIAKSASEVLNADRLILPGVGAFADCVGKLSAKKLDCAIREAVANKIPTLGICVGMQVLFEEGDEFGPHEGLRLIGGRVSKIPTGPERKVPHVGWAPLRAAKSWRSTVLDNLPDSPFGYFAHSFSATHFARDELLAYVEYQGIKIAAAVERGSLVACQFHPELSGPTGLAILKNFCRTA